MRQSLLIVGLLGVSGCSYTRFDDVTKDSPAVELRGQGVVSAGFASVTLRSGTSNYLLSSGVDAAALYSLGGVDRPDRDPSHSFSCASSAHCYLSSSPSAVERRVAGVRRTCAVFALGLESDGSGARLSLACTDMTRRVLPVPAEVAAALTPDAKFKLGEPQTASAADGSIAASLPSAGAVWWYPPSSDKPLLLTAPTGRQGWGAAMALSWYDGRRLLFIADAAGKSVDVLELMDDATVTQLGCVSDATAFASRLALGRFDKDAAPDLALSGAGKVQVIPGTKWAGLSPTCSAVKTVTAVPPAGCQEDEEVANCAAGEFGSSLAAADLDDDGRDELLVGAPGLSVRGESAAGAVFALQLGSKQFQRSDVFFVSSASSGDRLGSSVAAISLDGPDALVAGASGGGKSIAFYCSELAVNSSRSGRCR